MSMFRRPKKAIRPRVVTMGEGGEDDEDNNMSMEVDQVAEDTKSTKKERAPDTKATLLSFQDEEENDEAEVFKVKKSSVSRKLIKQRGKEKTGSSSNSVTTKVFSKSEFESREVIIEPGPTKPNTGVGRILTGREAEAVDMESGSEDDDSDLHFRRPSKSNVSEAVRLTLERAQIPDANLIHEAKKRRQLAREMQGPALPAVISLQDSRRRSEKTRFIREDDDNDKSDEDDRLDFSTATNAENIDREKRIEVFNAAEDEERDRMSDDESDLEVDEWEKQQISKAISKSQIQQATVDQQNYYNNSPQDDFKQSNNDHYNVTASIDDIYKEKLATANTSLMSTTITIEDIISGNSRVTTESIFKKLSERMDVLTISHDRNVGELSRLDAELELILNETGDSGVRNPQLSSRFMLFQKLRGYVAELIDCMRCKIPIIVDIEKRILDLMSTKAVRLLERRRKDTSDQLEEINSALRAISNSTSNMIQTPNTEELRIKRAAEREGRRTRRRRNRELKDVRNHKDGLSSDDEETDFEVTAYKNQLEALFYEASNVFEDVSEDFANIEKVIELFMEWRIFDVDSYKESYAFMCISKCISALVRLEIIKWDPLMNELDFNQFSWVNSLLKYNFKPGEAFRDICTDIDSKLIPSVAEKILIPWVERVVRAKWDPVSASQTRKLVNVVKKLIIEWYVAPNSKSIRNLLSCIISKFKDALENDVYIPIFTKSALTIKGSPASVFASRQFWTSVKLLDNMAVWAGILSDDVLQILALDALLTRYLLLGIRTAPELPDSVERANGIVAVIPSTWIVKDEEAEPPNGIQQLIHCLISMVQNADSCLAVNRIAIQEIAKILRTLGCALEAEMIMNKYS